MGFQIYDNGNQEYILAEVQMPKKYANLTFVLFLYRRMKCENVDEYRAGLGFHFVKMIPYLTKSDTHMF